MTCIYSVTGISRTQDLKVVDTLYIGKKTFQFFDEILNNIISIFTKLVWFGLVKIDLI